jgi:hypothetical protein
MERIPLDAYYTPDAVARARAGAATVAEVVGTSGHAWEAYAQACEAEVFVSPRVVRVTERGVDVLKKEGGT